MCVPHDAGKTPQIIAERAVSKEAALTHLLYCYPPNTQLSFSFFSSACFVSGVWPTFICNVLEAQLSEAQQIEALS